MNKIILILLLTIFVCLAVAEERELQEISLDKLMSDYLPEYKIEQQIQLEGEGRDFAVAKESGEIVAVTEIGSNYKVYYFNKESNLKWEKEFFGKGYEINCLISDNGTAIVITSYISEFTTNTVLDNLGNILFKKKLKAIEPDVIINQSQSIIKKPLLEIPKIGVLNRHNALLPKNRGRLTPF